MSWLHLTPLVYAPGENLDLQTGQWWRFCVVTLLEAPSRSMDLSSCDMAFSVEIWCFCSRLSEVKLSGSCSLVEALRGRCRGPRCERHGDLTLPLLVAGCLTQGFHRFQTGSDLGLGCWPLRGAVMIGILSFMLVILWRLLSFISGAHLRCHCLQRVQWQTYTPNPTLLQPGWPPKLDGDVRTSVRWCYIAIFVQKRHLQPTSKALRSF